MATRGNIGIVNDDGSITGIYVHFDAYPAYVGKTLLNCYTNINKINELMNLGDLSSLGENLFVEGHSWKSPIDGVCVAYGRDRGENWVDVSPQRFISEIEYHMNGKGVDYQYLFRDNKWYYRKVYGSGSFDELTAEICEMV